MDWSFDSPEHIQEFIVHLVNELEGIGETDLLRELKDWRDTFYTTSTEYFGELLVIIKQLLNNKPKLSRTDIKNLKRLMLTLEDVFRG